MCGRVTSFRSSAMCLMTRYLSSVAAVERTPCARCAALCCLLAGAPSSGTRSKDMSVLIHRVVRCLSLWSCLALLGACTHLPDVGPFVQSTAEVRSAVITAGTVAIEELKYLPEDKGATYAEKLSAQWQSRVRAMDGLVD